MDYFDWIADAYRAVFLYAVPVIMLIVGLVVIWVSLAENFQVHYFALGVLLVIVSGYYIIKQLAGLRKTELFAKKQILTTTKGNKKR